MLKIIKLQMAIFILYSSGYLTYANESRPKLILVFILDFDKKGIISIGDRMAGSIMKSVNRAQEMLPEFDLSEWEIIDAGCSAATTTKGLLNLWHRIGGDGKRIHGIIGPYCVDACKIISTFAGSYNIPAISHGCYFIEAGNEKFYPTLARVNGDVSLALATVLVDLILYKNIVKLALMLTEDVSCATEVVYHFEQQVRKTVGSDYKYTVKRIRSRAHRIWDPGFRLSTIIHTLLSLRRNGYQGRYHALRYIINYVIYLNDIVCSIK